MIPCDKAVETSFPSICHPQNNPQAFLDFLFALL